MQRKLYERTLS